ncbi:hypothetical protein ABH944_002985 [Caballeronia udeis]|uniref:Uncharacterized protein n=1 Tax=Caballeronia udeis TaxID=1232866 RepID=A0ABW8MJD0_9BURK
MGQREGFDADQSSAGDTERKPLAWRYMLGDGKWRYQWEWSNGAEMHPVYELTDEIRAELDR